MALSVRTPVEWLEDIGFSRTHTQYQEFGTGGTDTGWGTAGTTEYSMLGTHFSSQHGVGVHNGNAEQFYWRFTTPTGWFAQQGNSGYHTSSLSGYGGGTTYQTNWNSSFNYNIYSINDTGYTVTNILEFSGTNSGYFQDTFVHNPGTSGTNSGSHFTSNSHTHSHIIGGPLMSPPFKATEYTIYTTSWFPAMISTDTTKSYAAITGTHVIVEGETVPSTTTFSATCDTTTSKTSPVTTTDTTVFTTGSTTTATTTTVPPGFSYFKMRLSWSNETTAAGSFRYITEYVPEFDAADKDDWIWAFDSLNALSDMYGQTFHWDDLYKEANYTIFMPTDFLFTTTYATLDFSVTSYPTYTIQRETSSTADVGYQVLDRTSQSYANNYYVPGSFPMSLTTEYASYDQTGLVTVEGISYFLETTTLEIPLTKESTRTLHSGFTTTQLFYQYTEFGGNNSYGTFMDMVEVISTVDTITANPHYLMVSNDPPHHFEDAGKTQTLRHDSYTIGFLDNDRFGFIRALYQPTYTHGFHIQPSLDASDNVALGVGAAFAMPYAEELFVSAVDERLIPFTTYYQDPFSYTGASEYSTYSFMWNRDGEPLLSVTTTADIGGGQTTSGSFVNTIFGIGGGVSTVRTQFNVYPATAPVIGGTPTVNVSPMTVIFTTGAIRYTGLDAGVTFTGSSDFYHTAESIVPTSVLYAIDRELIISLNTGPLLVGIRIFHKHIESPFV